MSTTYPPPPPFTWPQITPRQLLPVFPPPEPLPAPPLPSPPRKPMFNAPYTLSTHIFPAAHLRTTNFVSVTPPPPSNATKEERRARAEQTIQRLKDVRGSIEPRGSRQVLWNCANRYMKQGLDGTRAECVTLFFAHANGFPKEIWEPTLQYLLCSPAASVIDEVWTWESVQHGDACLINGDKIGAVFDWTDNARDILNFLIYYLPSVASSAPLPTHLARLPPDESEYRKSNPFRNRTLLAIGHSYGGCTSALAALTHPKLFSSLVLIDPVIVKPAGPLIDKTEHDNRLALGLVLGAILRGDTCDTREDAERRMLASIPRRQNQAWNTRSEAADRLVLGALLRRETWSSREEALQILRQSPFFGAWDPAVLRIYLECGTYDTIDPTSGKPIIRLKMPGMQEAVVFNETHTECEVYHRLPTLDEKIELRWVVPGKPGAGEFGPPGATRERVWLRPKNASNIRIPNAGHLIAQEAPQALARDIQEFMERRYMAPRAHL
ncbi:putative alpha/beta hydrolase family protein [Lyophyllum shimeji]|uniref:Alpha/beta hydrolase family protein n=1 Tax=Lyophyllum shimeji TaxID=47721 RepID=A0A9P3PR35_LYOSH|nr:putative alpha/beta hydrolase family protein [Lyophyllum shimeji]